MQILKSTLVVLLCCCAVSPQGTISDLENNFKTRCRDYQTKRDGSLLSTSGVDCDSMWRNFSTGNMCESTYDGLFNFLKQTLPKNKVLFWSGTKEIAHKLSNNGLRYVTLEDTLIGYILDGVNWCGSVAFWNAASKWFASHANGEVQVILNGLNPSGAYRRDSVFRSIEVPNIRSDLVTEVTAFVVHDLDTARKEQCGDSSLLELKGDLDAKGIKFSCLDNPPEVLCLLCMDSPSNTECKAQSKDCDVPSGATGLINPDGIERHAALLLALATSLFVKVFSN